MSRVVVITGASAGVGRATARAFAKHGDDVALMARGQERLEATANEVRSHGVRALVVPTDVAVAAEVDAAARLIESELGPIDVWVNNAMTAVLAMSWDISAEDFGRVTEVNYLGFVHGTLAALRHMRPRNRGVIVQVGSALSYRAIPLQATYCASKFAIRGFTDSLRVELRHDGSDVRVTMVQLPGLNTPQFGWVKTTLPRHPQPVPPYFQPEVAATAIVSAAGRPRREVWVTASTVAVIVANKLAPRVADLYLARTNVSAQQSDIPIERDRPNDLWSPAPGDPGARGRFSEKAKRRSPQLTLSRLLRRLLP